MRLNAALEKSAVICMQSSPTNIESSIFKLFVTFNKFPELDGFIKLLIDSRVNPQYEGLESDVDRISQKLSELPLCQDYRARYVNELRRIKTQSHSTCWVAHQIHTGFYFLLNSSIFDARELERAYCIFKKIYQCICVYDLSTNSFKRYLHKKFQERDGALAMYVQGKAKYQTTIPRNIKEKIEVLFFALGFEGLYILSDKPTAQIHFERQRKISLARVRNSIVFIQGILIDNNFDISSYQNSSVFTRNVLDIIHVLTDNHYRFLNSSANGNTTFELTFLERVNLVKVLSFVDLDETSYQRITSAFSQQIMNNLDNQHYISHVVKPILEAALDYNLQPLAKMFSDFITQECSKISALIVSFVKEHPVDNEAKHYLLEAFDELSFEYDDDLDDSYSEAEDSQGITTKTLGGNFFQDDAVSLTMKKSHKGAGISPRRGESRSNAMRIELSHASSSGATATHQSSGRPRKIKTPCDDIRMYGGTVSRGVVISKHSSGEAPLYLAKLQSLKEMGKKNKRGQSDGVNSDSKRLRVTYGNDQSRDNSVQPIARVTNYFPSFTIPDDFLSRLPEGVALISHARGYHFYRCNNDSHPYYLVTEPGEREKILSDIEASMSSQLLSPAVQSIADEDARKGVLQSVKLLAATLCPGYPSTLHYMQEVYSNTFDRLHRTLQQEKTFSTYPYQNHPFVSFGDDITHAARYGFGQKVTGNRFEDRLRPIYHEDGSLENFFVGQLWITLQTWEEYCNHNKFHILSEHARGNISVGDRIINERETSFWSHVSSDSVALRLPLIIPSFFGEYPLEYLSSFGVTREAFNDYQLRIKKAFSSAFPRKEMRKIKNDIIKSVISHYEERINCAIQMAVEQKKSIQVFHGLSANFSQELPPVDASRVLHIYHKNQQQMDALFSQGIESLSEMHLQRCIRLLTAIAKGNSGGEVVVEPKKKVIAHVREFAINHPSCQLSVLLNFIENPENYEKIMAVYKEQEKSRLMEVDRLLALEKDNVEKLSTLSMEMIELFLLAIRESADGNAVFQRLLSLSQMANSQFYFFKTRCKEIFSHHFKGKSDLVIETLKMIKEKIENYNLGSHPSKSSQQTTAQVVASLSLSSVSSFPVQTGRSTNATALSQAIQQTFDSGKQKLLDALRRGDSVDIQKYLNVSSCNEVLDKINGDTLLHLAVRTHNPGVIKMVLRKKASRITPNNIKLTPIHLACASGKLAVFEAIYSSSVTLNASHLHEVVKSETSSDDEKRQLINYMFSQGIDISRDDLVIKSMPEHSEMNLFLKGVSELFEAIRSYISSAIATVRDPSLYKDVCQYEKESASSPKLVASKLVKLVAKKCHSVTDVGLIDSLKLAESLELSMDAIATILMRVHNEILGRGRVNTVIAATIVGDLPLLQFLNRYTFDYELMPHHRGTVFKKEIKKPITFAIQYARYDAFVFLLQHSTIDSDKIAKFVNTADRYLFAYKKLLALFNESDLLQQTHQASFIVVKQCCTDLERIHHELLELSRTNADEQLPSLQNSATLFPSSVVGDAAKVSDVLNCSTTRPQVTEIAS